MLHKTILFFCLILSITENYAQVNEGTKWIKDGQKQSLTKQNLSTQSLSKEKATIISKILYVNYKKKMITIYEKEWANKVIEIEDAKMPFHYQIFGQKPKDGYDLFISLHGGGATTAEENDRMYKYHQEIYNTTMKNVNGVYVALRAPTNTWDLWHQSNIDDFLDKVIKMFTCKLNINTNRIYLMGYSAGGDGVYQLATRMADRWAAAAMMAGHPGDFKPDNLYNLPFALHMGAKDRAYKRNKHAKYWKLKLEELNEQHPGHYVHQAVIHKSYGHGLALRDTVALHWMNLYNRKTFPTKIIWTQDNRHHEQFYWLSVPKSEIKTGGKIITKINNNTIEIIESYAKTLTILLNDELVNLNKPVIVKYQNKIIFNEKLSRQLTHINSSIESRGDKNMIYTALIKLKL